MIEQIKKLIVGGENQHVEFKKAKNDFPDDAFETICAFLNADGGTLILGITDDGNIVGVNSNTIDKIKTKFVTSINNQQIKKPTIYLDINDVKIEDENTFKFILRHNFFLKTLKSDTVDTKVTQSSDTVDTKVIQSKKQILVMEFCKTPKTTAEIMKHLGLKSKNNILRRIINPLIEQGLLIRTIPDKPNSSKQKYYTVTKNEDKNA